VKEIDLLPFPQLADRVARPSMRAFVRMVWPIAIPMLAVSILLIGVQSSWMQTLGTGNFDSGMLATIASLLVAFFFMAIWSMLCYGAIMFAAADQLTARPVSFWRSLREVLRPKVLFTLVLAMVILAVGFMLCFLPGLIAMPLLFLVVPVMVCEQLHGTDAIRRSIELVRFNATGRWADSGIAQACGLLFIGWGIQTVIGMLAQMPLMVFQQYYIWNETLSGRQADPFAIMNQLVWLQLPAQVVNVFAQLVGFFYWAFASWVLYLEIRRRQEGHDLAVAIPQILQGSDGA